MRLDTVFGRHTSLARSIALPDAGRVSKSDLVNPLFEHGHREAQAVALGDCLLLMAKERPTVIDGATDGAQSVLRPMSQGMDYLAFIDNADVANEFIEPL